MSFQRENLWKYDSEFDNTLVLNEHTPTVLFQPLVDYEEIKPVETDAKVSFMSAFQGAKKCINSLRLLSKEEVPIQRRGAGYQTTYFQTHEKNERSGDKRYYLLPYHDYERKGQKNLLSLDEPHAIVIIRNKLVVAVEKKCVSLYSIQGDRFLVKDFDAIGMGNRIVLVDSQHVVYKGRDFVLFFGNEKDDADPYFKVMIYEIIGTKLKYVKKMAICHGEVYNPIILFDNYPISEFKDEMFCLIIGGFEDYEQLSYYYGALQVHLHLLLEQWVDYDPKFTNQINFTKRITLSYGRAFKVTSDIINDQYWLLFSREHQTLSKMHIKFGNNNGDVFQIKELEIQTRKISIKDPDTRQVQPINFGMGTMQMLRVPNQEEYGDKTIPYRIFWCNKTLDKVFSRPLREFLKMFPNK